MYEVFTRKVTRTKNPVLSFSKLGQISFNQGAASILHKETVEYVLLLWDSTTSNIALKPTSNKKDARAYKIHFNDKSNGASFSAKTFLDFVGIDYSERRSIPIDINPNAEYIVEVKVPEEFFRKKLQHPRLVEKGKAG